jgi:hypothetical protein
MDFFHGFGIRDDEVVVASVVLLAAEMFGGQVLGLQACSHRAVEDEDFLFEGVEVTAVGVFAIHSTPDKFTFNKLLFFETCLKILRIFQRGLGMASWGLLRSARNDVIQQNRLSKMRGDKYTWAISHLPVG